MTAEQTMKSQNKTQTAIQNLNPNSTDTQMVNNNEIDISFQAFIKTMTGEQTMKSQNKYKEILKMFLVE